MMETLRKFGASCPWLLRSLGRGYLSYGKVMGELVTFLLMTVLYWLLIPFFSFLRIGDPMRLRRNSSVSTFWEECKHSDQTVERQSRMF